MSPETDAERARRIRDAQLKSRDPGFSKIPHLKLTQKGPPKMKEKPFLVELADMLPTRMRGMVIGIAIDLIPAVLAGILLPNDFKILGLMALLITGVVGYRAW